VRQKKKCPPSQTHQNPTKSRVAVWGFFGREVQKILKS